MSQAYIIIKEPQMKWDYCDLPYNKRFIYKIQSLSMKQFPGKSGNQDVNTQKLQQILLYTSHPLTLFSAASYKLTKETKLPTNPRSLLVTHFVYTCCQTTANPGIRSTMWGFKHCIDGEDVIRSSLSLSAVLFNFLNYWCQIHKYRS